MTLQNVMKKKKKPKVARKKQQFFFFIYDIVFSLPSIRLYPYVMETHFYCSEYADLHSALMILANMITICLGNKINEYKFN